ncbi:molybdopterin-guanine dinucleotide biosynthesis protein B [Silvimonas iriomotensis]|uniref:Molybdopterin-guanine dinucleotide biosynthesis protein MobB n=1 Tax=Silvimonas iriomotensis TaxID=449662 RepID=A0ABQ2PCF7_9NEIS|nr:molybdopterin-guanine dinucleotide biosynthesis protein B [Silvimonas iriomotensis]GGP23218.1 molybdopterin-guanine dinucleotide biosynthesis protein MobB [Silvimonas iriomotensis]
MTRRVFGLVGSSGSGKTTLLEKLIGIFTARGVSINAIKHSHHDIMLEPPDKDSARFRAAGAAEVMVVSPYRYAIFHELRDAPEPDIHTQLNRLAPADLTLIEGFRQHPFPKLEVWRDANGKPPRFIDDASIIALVSDDIAPQPHALALFGLDDLDAIADFIMQSAQDIG